MYQKKKEKLDFTSGSELGFVVGGRQQAFCTCRIVALKLLADGDDDDGGVDDS